MFRVVSEGFCRFLWVVKWVRVVLLDVVCIVFKCFCKFFLGSIGLNLKTSSSMLEKELMTNKKPSLGFYRHFSGYPWEKVLLKGTSQSSYLRRTSQATSFHMKRPRSLVQFSQRQRVRVGRSGDVSWKQLDMCGFWEVAEAFVFFSLFGCCFQKHLFFLPPLGKAIQSWKKLTNIFGKALNHWPVLLLFTSFWEGPLSNWLLFLEKGETTKWQVESWELEGWVCSGLFWKDIWSGSGVDWLVCVFVDSWSTCSSPMIALPRTSSLFPHNLPDGLPLSNMSSTSWTRSHPPTRKTKITRCLLAPTESLLPLDAQRFAVGSEGLGRVGLVSLVWLKEMYSFGYLWPS